MSNRRPLRLISKHLTSVTPPAPLPQPTTLLRLGVPGQASIVQQPASRDRLEQLLKIYAQPPQVKTATIFRHALNNVELPNLIITKSYVIDGGGAVITTGVKYPGLQIDFNCDIKEVSLFANASGSIVIDVWQDVFANYPPTDADSITASAPPTLSSAQSSVDTTLLGWTTSVPAGVVFLFNVDSVATITSVTISFKLMRRS